MLLMLGVAGHGLAQSAAAESVASSSVPSAKDLLQRNCAQCHNDAMWRDQRQDAKAWEATLYRMMGRGAVWSGDDIVTMATFLGTELGPQVPKIKR
jgi:hypothetical protein